MPAGEEETKVSKEPGVPILILIALMMGSGIWGAASARQLPAPRITPTPAILNVSVTDDVGQPLVGLRSSDFTISIESTHPAINYFSGSEEPSSIAILFDNSGSMLDRGERLVELIRQELLRFPQLCNPANQYLILRIADTPQLVTDWTSEELAFSAGIAKLGERRPKGQTALFDTCIFAMNKMSEAKLSRKVILLITDGQDNVSRYSRKTLRKSLERTEIILYSIDLADPVINSLSGYARTVLDELAMVSGGRNFYTTSVTEALQSLHLVAAEIRHQYVIGIDPVVLKGDAGWHEIKVLVRPHEAIQSSGTKYKKVHLDIRTRKRFFDALRVTGQ
jgi:Ca-activated chloride channel family protein